MTERYLISKKQMNALWAKYTQKHGISQEAFDAVVAHLEQYHEAPSEEMNLYLKLHQAFKDSEGIAAFIEQKASKT